MWNLGSRRLGKLSLGVASHRFTPKSLNDFTIHTEKGQQIGGADCYIFEFFKVTALVI